MANTTNIDLVKPAGTDHALVSVLNANSDKIDAEAGNVRSNFALVQNTNTATQAISKDQLVVWKGVLKKATSNIANGATLSNSNLTDTKVSTELASLSDQIANVANYVFGTAKVVDAITITQYVTFAAKIDCSNIVPNNKVLRILGAWIGVNPAGNTMMVAQNIHTNYVEIFMQSCNTQNISANSDVTVALLYKN